MFGLIILGAIATFAFIPLIRMFGWPPMTKWILVGIAFLLVVYALTLLPTRLVVSDEGLYQKQLFLDLRLSWSEIAEWRYVRVQDVEGFWIRDNNGKKYNLKKWLVFGKRRSRQLAEIMRQKGIAGNEDCDA